MDDPTVPVQYSRDMVNGIKAAGGTLVKYTEYPASLKLGHESWRAAEKEPELFRWVFRQSRAPAVTLAPRPARVTVSGPVPALPGLAVDGLGRLRVRPGASPFFLR